MIKVRVAFEEIQGKRWSRKTLIRTETIDLHNAFVVEENEAPFVLEISTPKHAQKYRVWQGKLYRCASLDLDLSDGVIDVARAFRSRSSAMSMTWLEPDAIIINDRAWAPATLPFLQVKINRYSAPLAPSQVILKTSSAFNPGDRGQFTLRDYDAALEHAAEAADRNGLPLVKCDPPRFLIPTLVPTDDRIQDRAAHLMTALSSLAETRRLVEEASAALLQQSPDTFVAHELVSEAKQSLSRAGRPLRWLSPSVS